MKFSLSLILLLCPIQETFKRVQGVDWVLSSYINPLDLAKYIAEKDNCSFHYVVRFERNGQFLTTINRKWAFRGKYRVRSGDSLRIFPRLKIKIYDPDEFCKIETKDMATVQHALLGVDHYHFKGDTLLLQYEIEGKQGYLSFIGI
jgi:hypothetical protein